MKKTLFFDLGNVLIFFDHTKMCSQVAKLGGLDEETATSLMQTWGDAYERGAISSSALHETVCLEAKTPLEFQALMRAMSDIFQPNPPVIALATQLKKKGHPLFLLSNTCEAHFAFAKTQFEFLNLFDGYVLSYEVGARKPESAIFEQALNRAGCAPSDCFYIDDILTYVDSARRLGIDAEQYTHPEALKAHLLLRGFI